jgi:hypothetical protein
MELFQYATYGAGLALIAQIHPRRRSSAISTPSYPAARNRARWWSSIVKRHEPSSFITAIENENGPQLFIAISPKKCLSV